MNWEGNSQVFRGYVRGNPEGDGKSPATKVKGKNLQKWSAVKDESCFGAILNDGFVDISFDSDELSQKFWDMAEANNWNCLILENQKNGHIHSFWKDSQGKIEKGGKDKKLAVGLVADIHSGSTYIPLRVHGVDRFPPIYEPDTIDEVPDELVPVNTQIDLLNLSEGEGRNDELFKYILILQSQLLLSKEDIRRVLQNTNDFVFGEPLKQDELDVICRDEAFEKPVFYNGKVFLHDAFGRYMKNEFHIKRINGQLHVYDNGIYKSGYRFLENKMIELIPALKANSRTEVLKYLEIITPEETYVSDANLIAFRNGVYDLSTDTLLPFSPEYIITNMIPWEFNESAYSELCDNTLNKISCHDPEIRSLLEEAVGYCFFRQNELSERFAPTTMFGKLACFGDDSDDSFLEGKAIAQFKKIVSGNDIKAENKGQDVYFFKPYTKLFFSFNELPRVRNKGFFAIKRRLVIIPFNATFSRNDPDFDSGIVWKLKTQAVAEYLIQLGIQGLKRVLANQGFTESKKVNAEIDSFERDNNPLLLFLDEVPAEEILNHETKEVFARYDLFCYENGFQKMAMQTFTKQINKHLGCDRKDVRINGKKVIIFKKGN